MKNILTLAMVPNQALILRQTKGNVQILAGLLNLAHGDVHQTALLLAVGILVFPGTPKPVNHPQFELAMQLLKDLHETNQINRKLRKTPKGMCADYEISRPSDEARKQYSEQRSREGKTYIGPRSVGTRAARRGVQRLVVSVGQALIQ